MSWTAVLALKVGLDSYAPTVNDLVCSIEQTDSVANAVKRVLEVVYQSSASPANGIGVGMQFVVETSAGNLEVGAAIDAAVVDISAGVEDFSLSFKTMVAGALAAEQMRLERTATAGDTAMLLYDVDNNTVERVTVGAADSGGVGFKVLRIPN